MKIMIKLATITLLSLLLFGCENREKKLISAKMRYLCKDNGGVYTTYPLRPEYYVACKDGTVFSKDRMMRTTIKDPAYYPDSEDN